MKIIKCDKCGKARPEKPEQRQDWANGSLCVASDYHSFDLCPKCAPKLTKTILRYIK
ncbi:hypothetical protein KJ910_05095 [Patescibacteria group bacterium]|nr:hypothetical protein [Patescibacteria group bacterium]MBU1906569.1 hypothetical protein [Patescibacteria group bacterium]